MGVYLEGCAKNHKIPKILVTYDSFRLVKEILKERNLFDIFHVVVDEFQSIFTDSRFKSTTEMEFIHYLSGVQKVCYVSATPMISEYLKDLKTFKDLPYFELDWDTYNSLRTVKPELKVRVVSSITSKAKEIIQEYKDGKFETYNSKDENGNIVTVESREAVFYVNSVSNITAIISGAKLKPEECNILCSRTDVNKKKIRKNLGKDFTIGKVPLKGEQHKMFTFCTRTVYLGADFYSTNAKSFILSDANIDCLAVDISLDLPQILGRQRDLSNPWKNRAEFYYKTLGKKNELTKEAFDSAINIKKQMTNSLLGAYNTCDEKGKQDLAKTYQKLAKAFNYKDDYVAVDSHSGSTLIPVVNELVIIAERRAYDIQQVDYKDRFSVFNTISNEGLVSLETTSNVKRFMTEFNNLKDFPAKMKFLCTYNLTEQERDVILDQVPLTYKNYYETLGPERCRANGYIKTTIDREYKDLQFDINKLRSEIEDSFSLNSKYTKSGIKELLRKIYTDLGYNKTPKANDLERYFEIKDCKVLNEKSNKWEHGFEILKIRYQEKVDLDD